ncbi:MAG: CsbD family protein [Rhodospirillales bacterium]|nr:CsbD family protein [Rhodospirillales bacterium]
MKWNQIVGRWNELGSKAKARWHTASDDDWQVVREKRDRLVAKIKDRCGVSPKEAEKQVKHYEDMQ